MLALMFLCLCIFGEGWPLSAPVLGLLVGPPCASHFVEQSGVSESQSNGAGMQGQGLAKLWCS